MWDISGTAEPSVPQHCGVFESGVVARLCVCVSVLQLLLSLLLTPARWELLGSFCESSGMG